MRLRKSRSFGRLYVQLSLVVAGAVLSGFTAGDLPWILTFLAFCLLQATIAAVASDYNQLRQAFFELNETVKIQQQTIKMMDDALGSHLTEQGKYRNLDDYISTLSHN